VHAATAKAGMWLGKHTAAIPVAGTHLVAIPVAGKHPATMYKLCINFRKKSHMPALAMEAG
jgi:hypothetical protein